MQKSVKTFIFPAIVVVGVVLFGVFGRTDARPEYTYQGEPEIVAATFASAWCSSCKILEPRLEKVMPSFAGKPVKFVRLDFTFGERDGVETLAKEEGLADIYPRFKGATGFTLLVDRNSGEILDMLTINHTQNAMRAAIAQAIAIAEQNKQTAAAAE